MQNLAVNVHHFFSRKRPIGGVIFWGKSKLGFRVANQKDWAQYVNPSTFCAEIKLDKNALGNICRRLTFKFYSPKLAF